MQELQKGEAHSATQQVNFNLERYVLWEGM